MPAAPADLLTRISFAGAAAALPGIPPSQGVGQILGPEDRNLVIGRAANLRRWFAGHLGAGKPPRPGRRPATDLSPVAATLAYAVAGSPFRQRLIFERLMGAHVPLSARRDLKRPAYLRLDPSERFPRLTVHPAGEGPLFGPFRERRAAQRALEELHKRIPLRPCDYSFEPDPALPLGLGCLYAQVRSCAAPCLARVSEHEYAGLVAQAAAFLSDPERRDEEFRAWLPDWVAREGCALVVERVRGRLELYPVSGAGVFEEGAAHGSLDELDETVARLSWPAPGPQRDDRPWLSAWLHSPRKTSVYLALVDPDRPGALAARIRRSLGAPSSSSDNVTPANG